jgi:hypothetical protein
MTKPSECAIAFALPRNEAQFVEDLRAGPAKDFAAHLTEHDAERVRKAGNYASWWYSNTPERPGLEDLLDDVLQASRRAGVTVLVDADFTGFLRLLDCHDVVTLVSHWKSDRLLIDDVVSWQSFAGRIAASRGGILGWILARLSTDSRAALEECRDGMHIELLQKQEIVNDVNTIIRSDRYSEAKTGEKHVLNIELLDGFHNRNVLDGVLGNVVRPGNCVEFRDGLYRPEIVTASIPESFHGILDLTLCNSIFLAEAIKSHRSHRNFIILSNENATGLKLRLLLYKHVIDEVAKTESSYRNTVRSFRSVLIFGRRSAMPTLKQVLTDATSHDEIMLGGEDSRESLRTALEAVRARNERYFVLVIGVLLAFFVGSWVIVYLHLSNPTLLTAVFGALGGTVYGSIWLMVKLWRRKVATDIILATYDDLSAAERRRVMQKILEII